MDLIVAMNATLAAGAAVAPLEKPLWLDVTADSVGVPFIYRVYVGGTEVYRGRAAAPACIDIADIVAPYMADTQLPPPDTFYGANVTPAGIGYALTCHCTVQPAAGIAVQQQSDTVTVTRGYAEVQQLVTAARFFATTRTAGTVIEIPETEVTPLLFYAASAPFNVVPVDFPQAAQTVASLSSVEPYTPYLMHIEVIRRRIYNNYQRLCNAFDIVKDGATVCQILITKEPVAKERYTLLYRNRYGAWDRLALQATLDKSIQTPQDAAFRRYDAATGLYATHCMRTQPTVTIKLNATIPQVERAHRLAEALESDALYIEGWKDQPARVINRTQQLDIPAAPVAPLTLNVTLEVAEPSLYAVSLTEQQALQQRIHSTQFSGEFN